MTNAIDLKFYDTQPMTGLSISRSEAFSVYNKARRVSRLGLLSEDRVNRALGYIQSGQAQRSWFIYRTTIDDCQCPDRRFRGCVCKHMIARQIAYRVLEARGGDGS